MKVNITKVNISSPKGCEVATEKCKEEAYWFINGKKSLCDKHLKEFCKITGIDYDGVIKEVKRKFK